MSRMTDDEIAATDAWLAASAGFDVSRVSHSLRARSELTRVLAELHATRAERDALIIAGRDVDSPRDVAPAIDYALASNRAIIRRIGPPDAVARRGDGSVVQVGDEIAWDEPIRVQWTQTDGAVPAFVGVERELIIP